MVITTLREFVLSAYFKINRELVVSFLSPHPQPNRRCQPEHAERIYRQVTRERIKQSVPVVDGADGVDEGVVEGAGEDAFRGLVDGCHGK